MTYKKPKPIGGSQERAPCPVCGKPSYSAAGIHPQCAVVKADQAQKANLKKKEAEKKEKQVKDGSALGRWQKECPKCKQPQHVRIKRCDCGHEFIKSFSKSDGDASG